LKFLGNPDDVIAAASTSNCVKTISANWKTEFPKLKIQNVAFDVTPANFVTAVVTELGFLPCTSG